MQVCTSCGHENRPGILFCENCGTSLTGEPAAGSTKGLENEVQPGLSEQIVAAGTDFLPSGAALRVEIEGGPEPIVILPRQELIFGRRDPATGAMPDIDLTPYAGYRMGVSRRHAAIRSAEENRLDVWDLGSSNGTYLNGMRLNPHRPYRLHDGDRIRLGQMVIRILFTAPLEETEGAPSTRLQAAITAAAAAEAAALLPQDAPRTRSAEELEAAINRTLDPVAEEAAAEELPAADGQPAADSQPAVEEIEALVEEETVPPADNQPAEVIELPAPAEIPLETSAPEENQPEAASESGADAQPPESEPDHDSKPE